MEYAVNDIFGMDSYEVAGDGRLKVAFQMRVTDMAVWLFIRVRRQDRGFGARGTTGHNKKHGQRASAKHMKKHDRRLSG
jgi:hypothetical protein